MERTIRRALVSVFDKAGLEGVLQALHGSGVELVASGGTYDYIVGLGLPAERVEEITHFPHILGGRVKTLHPHIFGGILARRGHEGDEEDMRAHGLRPIDLVVVDLYPFARTLASGGSEEELIEKIDIGGVSLIRAAAKNFHDVLVISSRGQYGALRQIALEGCVTTLAQRRGFAAAAFAETRRYDSAIGGYFAASQGGAELGISAEGALPSALTRTPLRYGENPHQQGVFQGDLASMFTQLHGKEVSYNNLLDLHAGVGLIEEFEETAVAILKHGTPCGVAVGATLHEAWARALSTDPQSAFGGVIVMNREVDGATAEGMHGIFFEVCLAPGYSEEALRILAQRKNRVLLVRGEGRLSGVSVRSALNGVLVQEVDGQRYGIPLGDVVTTLRPTAAQESDLLLANRVVKHCKSNAIALALGGRIVGVGAGETSRIEALQHAVDRALRFGHSLVGASMASDAFFPFPDCVELAAEHGVCCIVQPGGSVRDADSIAACEAGGISMVFTHRRHFKH